MKHYKAKFTGNDYKSLSLFETILNRKLIGQIWPIQTLLQA
jgi:hypothetical protein